MRGISKLFVADPGLRARSGHNVAALEAMASLSDFPRMEFYVHRDATLPDCAAHGSPRIHPHFEAYFYDVFWPSAGIADVSGFVELLTGDYERMFLELAQEGEGHLVLHHTMDWPHLLALGLANQRVGAAAHKIRHLVFLMFHPGVSHDLEIHDPKRYLSYRVALSRLGRQENVRLFAGGAECQRAFGHMAPEFAPYPIYPCFFTEDDSPAETPPLTGDNIDLPVLRARMALFMGDAKVDKGFLELPGLIEGLAGIVDRQAEFVVAYNVTRQMESGPIRDAVEALESLAHREERLKLSRTYLSNTELRDTLRASEFLLFNYDPAVYAEKTSGLLWLAARHNKPVVVVGRSWLTREAERLGVPLCVVDSVTQLLAMIAAKGAIRFAVKAADALYRDRIFRPLGDFLHEVVDGALAKVDRTRPTRVLFIDEFPPNPKASGGGYAATSEIRLFQGLGATVDFISLSLPASNATENLAELGVTFHAQGLEALARLGQEFDHVYISRYHAVEAVMQAVREHAPRARLVVNVADLHFLRAQREAELLNDAAGLRRAEALRESELAILGRCDLVLTYSDVEKRLIDARLGGTPQVGICPWVERIAPAVAPFEARHGIAYLGGFSHGPNVDAVRWFVEHVMPLLRASLPGLRFFIYGADVPPAVEALQSEDVSVLGFVEDVAEVYDRCRVFVAPLRYGAGLKAKVAGALARGVPCVLSPIAAEGFSVDGVARIATNPREWESAIRVLHGDRASWQAMSTAALTYGARTFSFKRALERFREVLATPSAERSISGT